MFLNPYHFYTNPPFLFQYIPDEYLNSTNISHIYESIFVEKSQIIFHNIEIERSLKTIDVGDKNNKN